MKTPEESSPLCSREDQRFVFLRTFVSRLNWINLSRMRFSSWDGNGLKTCTRCLQISTRRHRESIRCVGRSVSRSADGACSHADLPIHHFAAWWKQCEDMSRRACTCTDKVVQGRSPQQTPTHSAFLIIPQKHGQTAQLPSCLSYRKSSWPHYCHTVRVAAMTAVC